jgi:hypothetical protein
VQRFFWVLLWRSNIRITMQAPRDPAYWNCSGRESVVHKRPVTIQADNRENAARPQQISKAQKRES